MWEHLPFFAPLAVLYPEIHYRFRAFPFSLYYRRRPEIIADAPHRLEPRQALPVLLLIKDADSFPLTLDNLTIEAKSGRRTFSHNTNFSGEVIKRRWWHHIEWVNLPDESPCDWKIDVTWRVQIGSRRFVIRNDNLPGLSHSPLKVFQSGEPLPRSEGWIFGDLHVHTAYTEDQVEFGAPLAAYAPLGEAQGLNFAFAADHSYDLDDLPGSFTRNDPGLMRFDYRNMEIQRLNEESSGRFVLLPGFELTARNIGGKNVHLLLINQQDFLPGSGDSAERWLATRSESTITEVLNRLEGGVLPIAAHPAMKPALLQRWLLGRGHWDKADLDNTNLFGLQVWNGEISEDFRRGVQIWVQGLLSGKQWRFIAGSDAHGNFNRYRQVGFPMLKLIEADKHVFGTVRTGVHLTEALSANNLFEALKSGRSLVTNGPFAEVSIDPQNDSRGAKISACSTSEFGSLSDIKLWWGKKGRETEQSLWQEQFNGDYSFESSIPLGVEKGYLRLEVLTSSGRLCLTNPVFL